MSDGIPNFNLDKTIAIKLHVVEKLSVLTELKAVYNSRIIFTSSKIEKYPLASVYCLDDSATEMDGERSYNVAYNLKIVLINKGLDISQIKDESEQSAIEFADLIAAKIKVLLGDYLETLGANVFRLVYKSTNTTNNIDGDNVVVMKVLDWDVVSFENRNVEQ